MKTTYRLPVVLSCAILFLASPVLLRAAPAPASLEGKKIGILIGPGFHDGETLIPAFQLRERGAQVVILGVSKDPLTAYNSEVTIPIQTTLAEVEAGDFHALVLPGGQGPSHLREDHNVIRFVREFAATGRPIAAICHGPQVLASAGLLKDVSATCFPGIRREMQKHGARYVDKEVEVDGQFITSRLPMDIPAFMNALIQSVLAGQTS